MRSIDRLTAHADVSEKMIERHLSIGVAAMGGVSLKYSNPGMAGYPDRVCLLPGGVTLWVELKSKGGQLRPLQRQRISKLLRMGHDVHVCDSREAVDNMLERYKTKKQ